MYYTLTIEQMLGVEVLPDLIRGYFAEPLNEIAENICVWLEVITPKDTTQLSQSWFYASATNNTIQAAKQRAYSIAYTHHKRKALASYKRNPKRSRHTISVTVPTHARSGMSMKYTYTAGQRKKTGMEQEEANASHRAFWTDSLARQAETAARRRKSNRKGAVEHYVREHTRTRFSFNPHIINFHMDWQGIMEITGVKTEGTFNENIDLDTSKVTSINSAEKRLGITAVLIGNITDYARFVNDGHYANGTYVPGKFMLEAALAMFSNDMMQSVGTRYSQLVTFLNKSAAVQDIRIRARDSRGRFI